VSVAAVVLHLPGELTAFAQTPNFIYFEKKTKKR